MRGLLVAAVLAGCYQPAVPIGVRCSQSGDCPEGQMCDQVRGVCGGSPIDGSTIADIGIDTLHDTPTDGTSIDAPMLVPWGAPQPIEALNTLAIETDPTISGDGLELFFGSDRPGGVGAHDLYRSARSSTTVPFGPPVIVAELSTVSGESAPELANNDLTLYFRRAGDIFRSTRPNRVSPFAPPILDSELSSTDSDTNPALSPDGLTACITREFATPNRDLYLYRRSSTAAAWGTGLLMTELTTPTTDSGAAFTTDPLELYFHSDRAGDTSIYRATRTTTSAPFTTPVVVAEITTAASESDPSISADRRIMVFERAENLMIATR